MLPPLTLNAWLSHDYIVAEVCRLPAGAAVLEVGAGRAPWARGWPSG